MTLEKRWELTLAIHQKLGEVNKALLQRDRKSGSASVLQPLEQLHYMVGCWFTGED